MQVKFVDRTFNYDEKRACEIVKFILENDNKVTNFHFEICADLVSERLTSFWPEPVRDCFSLRSGYSQLIPILSAR